MLSQLQKDEIFFSMSLSLDTEILQSNVTHNAKIKIKWMSSSIKKKR